MPTRLHFALASSLVFAAALDCGGSAPPPSNPTVTAAPPYTPVTAPGADAATDAKIRASLAGSQRTAQERARDGYRHPLETLEFFGLRADMTVVEISPGGGWYTAVLAPVLRDSGKLFVAGGDPNGDAKSEGTSQAIKLQSRFKEAPDAFGKVQTIVIAEGKPIDFGAPGSVDMVLTFRNFHNWVGGPEVDSILAAAFAALKHGGVLGMTDHRANPGVKDDRATADKMGYVTEDFVIQTVQKAGFQLAGKSEVNANPKDTKDYAKGVWALPPSFDGGSVDHDKYAAIGESDRMTLKFVKP
jgi:predicted methyltransferase